MTNPYCTCGHLSRNHADEGFGACKMVSSAGAGIRGVKACTCPQFNNNEIKILEEDPVSEETPEEPLVAKARSELQYLNLEYYEKVHPGFEKGFLEMVQIWASLRLANADVEILAASLKGRPLGPLTDDPEEWELISESPDPKTVGLWRNRRDKRMFSADGGETYWDAQTLTEPGFRVQRTVESKFIKRQTTSVFDPPYDR